MAKLVFTLHLLKVECPKTACNVLLLVGDYINTIHLSYFFGKRFKPWFSEGRSSGEAYIELETEEDITRVLEMDKSV